MLRIDLYTDVICPWCLIGQRRLDKVLTERVPNLVVDIRHHPVLLMPDVPAAGLYIADLLRARHGVTDLKAAFSRPEAEARASGLDLDLSRQPLAYPSQSAHALILAARERGTQHVLAVAISEAYFLQARNIADAEVLADIAADHGFDRVEARAIALDPGQRKRIELEAAKSAAAGVRSIPHFVFGGRVAINGGRSEDEIASSMLEAASASGVS
jgi:predicted DsbA family dithiol-disulfide isomerase